MKFAEQAHHRVWMLLTVGFLYLTFMLQSGANVKSKHASIDFASYYTAARAVFVQGTSPYRLKNLEVYAAALNKQQIYPYVYPPPSLLLFTPLASLNFQQAQWLAFVVNHLALLGVLILLVLILRKRFQVMGIFPILLLSVYLFNFEPLVDTFTIGQINLLILLCLCGIWWLTSAAHPPKGSEIVMGLLLAVAILLKVYPAILVLFFLVRKDFKVIAFTLVWLGFFSFITYQLLPHSLWTDWADLVQARLKLDPDQLDPIPSGYPWNISLNGFFSRLFIENRWTKPVADLPVVYAIFLFGTSFILMGLTIWKSLSVRLSGNRLAQHQVFGLYLFTMFLIAPFSWGHHLVLLLPGILLVMSFLTNETWTKTSVMLVIGSLFILGLKLPYWHRFFYSPLLTWVISVKMYAVVVLWVYIYRKLDSVNSDNAAKVVNL